MPEQSQAVKFVWRVAELHTSEIGLNAVEPELLLIALCRTEKFFDETAAAEARGKGYDLDRMRTELSLVPRVLKELKINPQVFSEEIRASIAAGPKNTQPRLPIRTSEKTRRVFLQAELLATADDAPRVNTGHLFVAILNHNSLVVTRVFQDLGGDIKKAAYVSTKMMDRTLGANVQAGTVLSDDEKSRVHLRRYGRDLTNEAKEGTIGPVIGRREELLQIIRTIAGRTRNNPVLIGEPGVGKTAIVHGIAIRIAAGKDSHVLGGKRILELSVRSLLN
jgi:ATP-dependent Clp protease ATP-binding subunit ClpA